MLPSSLAAIYSVCYDRCVMYYLPFVSGNKTYLTFDFDFDFDYGTEWNRGIAKCFMPPMNVAFHLFSMRRTRFCKDYDIL